VAGFTRLRFAHGEVECDLVVEVLFAPASGEEGAKP